jgi:hypothetical protein
VPNSFPVELRTGVPTSSAKYEIGSPSFKALTPSHDVALRRTLAFCFEAPEVSIMGADGRVRFCHRRQGRRAAASGEVPVVGRIFPAPLAMKVPEVIFLFWVVKILTTAG